MIETGSASSFELPTHFSNPINRNFNSCDGWGNCRSCDKKTHQDVEKELQEAMSDLAGSESLLDGNMKKDAQL